SSSATAPPTQPARTGPTGTAPASPSTASAPTTRRPVSSPRKGTIALSDRAAGDRGIEGVRNAGGGDVGVGGRGGAATPRHHVTFLRRIATIGSVGQL